MAIKIALAGNPNCGKTTLFNALTGANQYVGNWPGVTVEKKEGKLKGYKDVRIVDLPGIYSLSPYTLEEVVARNYIVNEKPDAIINIVDGTNLERNLYLSTQVMELGVPVLMAINMMDVVKKNGDKINLEGLSQSLGCQVVEISALHGDGIKAAADKAVELAKTGNLNKRVHAFSRDCEDIIAKVEDKIGSDVPDAQKRFFAIKLLEKDDKIHDMLSNVPDVSAEIKEMEDKFDDDTESIITNERYTYISSIIDSCIKKNSKRTLSTSDKIDRIVTNRILALPIFAVIMYCVYYLSVSSGGIGTIGTDWVNDVLFGDVVPPLVTGFLESIHCAAWLQGLIVDGIIAGVGAVLGFVPQMLVLFFCLAFLEGCGYMARIAFIMDRIFRKFGLSGKSFIPILIGTGCGVPGVMASRTIENERDRRMTIITTTFIPCSAKLPIIALIAGAFFPDQAWVGPSAYFIGIAAIIVSGIILKKTRIFAGDPAPFVMELPAYHLPTPGSILRAMWERAWSFIKKAGTIILLSTIVLWFLMSFGWVGGHFGMLDATQLESSILAKIGHAIGWIFIPQGWNVAPEGGTPGLWKFAVAAVSGLIAKENVVATVGMLFGVAEVAEDGKEIWGQLAQTIVPVAAYSYLVFNLLCAPCFAAMGAIKREMNSTKWFFIAIGYQCGFAYLVSMCIFQFGGLITGVVGFNFFTILSIAVVVLFVYLLLRPYKEPTEFVEKSKAAA